MKQKDIVLIIVIVFISGVFSLVLSNLLISSSDNRQQEVEVVEPITADFAQPSDKYFNSRSTNPTQLIQISENKNQTPFNNGN